MTLVSRTGLLLVLLAGCVRPAPTPSAPPPDPLAQAVRAAYAAEADGGKAGQAKALATVYRAGAAAAAARTDLTTAAELLTRLRTIAGDVLA
jgi:hypothetical protein